MRCLRRSTPDSESHYSREDRKNVAFVGDFRSTEQNVFISKSNFRQREKAQPMLSFVPEQFLSLPCNWHAKRERETRHFCLSFPRTFCFEIYMSLSRGGGKARRETSQEIAFREASQKKTGPGKFCPSKELFSQFQSGAFIASVLRLNAPLWSEPGELFHFFEALWNKTEKRERERECSKRRRGKGRGRAVEGSSSSKGYNSQTRFSRGGYRWKGRVKYRPV